MTPDVNVLLAASRSDHPHHAIAYACLDEAVAACSLGDDMKIMPMVAASFLRLATHPRIFVRPTPMDAAMGFLDSLLAVPGVDMPSLGAEWPMLRELCLEKKLVANDIPDAWLAAAVIHYGEHLVTFDADFKKLLRRQHLTVLIPE
ncbi:MAG: PIN domain-containing protein [Zoogloeaceae bacterium]|nr:PIN domain-containing protein [Zoogloeaceae bacterium]MCK6382821.1 PIN domain-containing protein [Rhodocyclaceae bacterium]